jgi:hypothetical protein
LVISTSFFNRQFELIPDQFISDQAQKTGPKRSILARLKFQNYFQKTATNKALEIKDVSRLCLQATFEEMLGSLQDNTTGSCNIFQYRIEISTSNENGQIGITI